MLTHDRQDGSTQNKLTKEVDRPLYYKAQAWLLLLNTIVLFVNISVFLISTSQSNVAILDNDAQRSKCLSWMIYNPDTKAWRWRADHLNEYFPTREDGIDNCVAMFKQLDYVE